MPLHVNLYHEVQRQELNRKRDPLRLGMLGLLVIAIGFVGYYFFLMGAAHVVTAQYDQLANQVAQLDPKAKAAKDREAELNVEIAASQTMRESVDGRFYMAPVLDQILKTVPPTVQLLHMEVDAPDPGRPDAISTVTITGISSDVEPRKEAEVLRTALNTSLGARFKNVTAVFKDLEDSDEVVVYNGQRLATATFTIQVQLQPGDPVAQTATAAKTNLASAK
jgi:Tfp pilus assembly protein PilN